MSQSIRLEPGIPVVPTRDRVPVADEAELDRMVCEAVLHAVHTTGRVPVLWHLLDRCLELIPMMVVVLEAAGEGDLVVDLMQRYFPDEPGSPIGP